MKNHKQVGLGILAVLCSMLAGCQSPDEGGATAPRTNSPAALPAAEAPPAKGGDLQPAREVFPAQFQATVYEVDALAGRADSLDAKALEKQAGTAELLLEALSKAGTARILYRFDQPVNVLSQKLLMGTSEPLVTGTRISAGGEAINSVTYHQIGASLHLSAPAPGGKRPEVTVDVQLSVLAHGGVEIAPGQKAQSIRTLSMEHQAELEFGRPRVMMAVDSASHDEKQQPVIYVIRYMFSR